MNSQFKPGHSGRPKGSRNKLCRAMLDDLMADWAEGGPAAIKIMRIERPSEYVRAMISILPKELILESGLADIGDAELDSLIESLRARALEVRQEQTLELQPEKPKALINGRH
jgi:hypothetical protein